MKLWIVRYAYDAYEGDFVGVFTSQEKAAAWLARHSAHSGRFSVDEVTADEVFPWLRHHQIYAD